MKAAELDDGEIPESDGIRYSGGVVMDAEALTRELLAEPIERADFYWHAPEYRSSLENWNALATENEVHAAISARDEKAEQKKSRKDIAFVTTHAGPGGRLLDVGCGYGRLAKYLLPSVAFEAYVGLDSSRVMLGKFQERYAARPEEQTTPLVLVQADIDRLPLRDGSIDCCVVSAVFLHNHKDVTRRSIGEIVRVLKPGGKLLAIGSFPNAQSLTGLQGWAFLRYLRWRGQEKKNGPVRYFSRVEILGLLDGFTDVAFYPSGFSVYPKMLLGLPAFLRWHYRRFYDILHGFLRHHLPKPVQDIFCVYHDVVAAKVPSDGD